MTGVRGAASRVLETNTGFTGGNNVIIRPALESRRSARLRSSPERRHTRYPNAFKALVDFMDQHPNVGIAGSAEEGLDGTPLCSAFRFPSPLSEFEGSVKLRVVSRLLERWVVALPVSEEP